MVTVVRYEVTVFGNMMRSKFCNAKWLMDLASTVNLVSSQDGHMAIFLCLLRKHKYP